jgi:type IX secretion system PorP/SprF family membrane protein
MTILYGQQLPDYSVYRNSWMLTNPASFARNYLIQAHTQTLSITSRYQWTKLADAPKTMGVQYQNILEEQHISIGGSLINDQTGAIGSTLFQGNFAYMIPLSTSRKAKQLLSIGLSAGLLQYRVHLSEITFNEAFQNNMPLDNQLAYTPNFGLGVFYYMDNIFYINAAIPQIFNPRRTLSNTDFVHQKHTHYYASIGGFIPFSNRIKQVFQLEPSIKIRYIEGLPINLEMATQFHYKNLFWLGGAYNLTDAYHLELGYILPNQFQSKNTLQIGLNYTYNANSFGNVLGNTFELNISYSWGESQILTCPTFF